MVLVLLLLLTSSLMAAETSPARCAPCHRAETVGFAHAGMTRALESGKNSEILRNNPKMSTKMSAKIGAFSYEISREGEQSIYTVGDGKDTIRVPLAWAFGLGAAGQTYLYEREGSWYESRVSYYSALKTLDVTMGADALMPRKLEEAAGRQRSVGEVAQCFACHATNAVKGAQLTLDRMTPGIQCERCHGDTSSHPQSASPRKLGSFTSEEMSEFCGQCHRTWSQIMMTPTRGVSNVRFQPYRLANSKCYSADDDRIKCTSCHNPHRDVETSAAAYDRKCLSCHSAKATPATNASTHRCKVATENCVTCHMPKVELPGSHNLFTDHQIRIARANEKFPD